MKRDEDISILLTEKNFRKILAGWDDLDEKEKADICREYELTIQDVKLLRQLWSGLDFKFPEYPSAQIETALNETVWKIAERKNQVTGKSFAQKMYGQFAKIAAILIIPLILYTVYFQIHNSNSSVHNPVSQIVTVNSQPGTITRLVLPDGTKVCLNAGSSISYPNFFTGEKREVSLSGEAYFDVVKNKEMPMEVLAKSASLKVYGTSFNVNAFPEDEFAKITLVEGSISLSSPSVKFNGKNELYIKPGQTVTFYNNSEKLEVENRNTFLYTAWTKGLLVFKNATFESMLKQLSRKYNIDIEIRGRNLTSIPMDATFSDENIEEILRLLSLSTPFKFHYGPQHKLPDGTFAKSKIYIDNK